jgi:signal transduction histidine kinase
MGTAAFQTGSRRGGALTSGLVVLAAIAVDLLFWDSEVRLAGGGTLPVWLPPLITVAVHQSLWWRVSRPLAVFWVQVAFGLVSLAVPLWQPFAGLLIALYAVATRAPTRQARVALGAMLVPFLAHGIGSAQASVVPLQTLLVLTSLWWLVGGATWFAGRRRRHSSARIRKWHADQEALLDAATRAERLALARELHDGVANTITTVLIQAAVARQAAGAGDQALSGIETAARRAMEEIQAMLRLMPREGAEAGPGLADLPELLAVAAAAGLDVRVTTLGAARPLDRATELAVYRAVQEGVTNALKYAPPGAACDVELRWSATELVVTVLDRGAPRPSAAPPTGFLVRPFPADPPPVNPPAGNPPPVNPSPVNPSPLHSGPEAGPANAARSLPATGGRGLAGLSARVAPLGGWVESGVVERGFRLAAGVPLLRS